MPWKLLCQSFGIAWLALAAVACGGDDDDDDTGMMNQSLVIPCEVEAVLAAKCQRCHGDPQQNGAPFPLLTLEQVHLPYGSGPDAMPIYTHMATAVENGTMPYRAPSIMPPVEALTDEEKTILLDWLNAGADGVMATCE
jgi:uncharacterized membrane protein